MLSSLRIESFKCFEDTNVSLCNLTVLSGSNSSGKSSVLQALILLADLVLGDQWANTINLNRPGLKLGAASNVINYRSSRNSIALRLSSGDATASFELMSDDRQALSMDVQITESSGNSDGSNQPKDSAVRASLQNLKWVSSERIGPRDVLPLLDSRMALSVGFDGADAAALLYWNEDKAVPDRVTIEGVPNNLYNQVRGRLRELFPSSDFRVVRVDNAIAMSLGFKSGVESEFQRPQNVGFGYSQVFPLLVELLNARPGDLVLIENPEIHLHPKAQQDLAVLISLVASSGVQVLLETHSDHILNGVRLAVKRKLISPDRVVFNFFESVGGGDAGVVSPRVDEFGKLSFWPSGFFDQFDVAIAELL
ncbi:MAG: DUF3696 domain-containing protein [Fimbriimonadaceae bacterium]|nr:DUF3696 domain-containing protein [Fimbriimonadaceae bacterium]